MDVMFLKDGFHVSFCMKGRADEVEAVEVLGIDGFLFGKLGVCRKPHEQPVFHERDPVALVGAGFGKDGAGEFSVLQRFQKFTVASFPKVHGYIGIKIAVAVKHRRQPDSSSAGIGSDEKLAGCQGKDVTADSTRLFLGKEQFLIEGRRRFPSSVSCTPWLVL